MRPVRLAVLGIVTAVLLAGCSNESADPSAETPSSVESAPSTGGDADTEGSEPEQGGASSSSDGDPSASPDTGSGAEPGNDDGDSDSDSDSTSPDYGATSGAEMPMAPETSPTSLSELLPAQSSRPLISLPLPRSATARGRLVGQFPKFLRPTRASTVETSSLSPAGDRLQATLVGATLLSPEAVLRAYRVRLGARGLAEDTAPPTVGGSQAAAFRRGLSAVTVTVTAQGAGSSYSVHAVLHAGRE
ncbi:MAG: hypothetical protein LH477_18640 [Nocardioides sp.]|nr:hypothetical protein [Nocardioides sp.]